MNEFKVINKTRERLFSKAYHDFLRSDKFDGKEKIVFLMLKMFADFRNDNGETAFEVYPSQETLARYLGMTRKTVSKIINSLEKKGVVESKDQGRNKPKIYYLYDYAKIWGESEKTQYIKENAGKKRQYRSDDDEIYEDIYEVF